MTRRDNPLLTAVGLLVLFTALVLVAPGALLTFLFEHLCRIQLDVGQRWTRGIGSSAVAANAMPWRSRDGLGRYMLLAVVALAAVLVARFGVHARWVAKMLGAHVP
jgi:hypothetical protein